MASEAAKKIFEMRNAKRWSAGKCPRCSQTGACVFCRNKDAPQPNSKKAPDFRFFKGSYR